MDYAIRATRYTVQPTKACIFSECVTHVEIEDEAAGEFIVLSQDLDSGTQKISLNIEEWPLIQRAVTNLIDEIQKHEKEIDKETT